MIERLRTFGAVNRIRRNHAVEHAAISVITERHPTVFLRGRSNRKGFYIFGEVDTEELRSAIDEALQRLRQGEAELAIHPRCGTNLAVAGILSGFAAAAGASMRPRPNRYAFAVLASLGALMVAPEVGATAQRHLTTLADVSSVRIVQITRKRFPFLREPVHWVKTESR